MRHNNARLERIINDLKQNLREAGAVYKAKGSDSSITAEMAAIVDAINVLELNVYDRKITTILDCL